MVISLWILESESDAVCGMLSSDFKRYTLRVRSSNKLSGPSSPHDKLSHHHAFLVPRETIMYRLSGPREAAVLHSRQTSCDWYKSEFDGEVQQFEEVRGNVFAL